MSEYILHLSYAQRPLEDKRRNPSCGGGWGLVTKLHWCLTLEVVLCPWTYEFPLSFGLVTCTQLFSDFLRKFYFKSLHSLNCQVKVPSSVLSFSSILLVFPLIILTGIHFPFSVKATFTSLSTCTLWEAPELCYTSEETPRPSSPASHQFH